MAEIGLERAFAQITAPLGWPSANLDELLASFDPHGLPREPLYLPAESPNSSSAILV
jgi:glutamyl-tRNA synthetase